MPQKPVASSRKDATISAAFNRLLYALLATVSTRKALRGYNTITDPRVTTCLSLLLISMNINTKTFW